MRTALQSVLPMLIAGLASAQDYGSPPPATVQQTTPVATSSDGTTPDVVGHIGAGYFTTTAPLGVRYWFSETGGVDVGLGLSIQKPAGGGDTTKAIGFEAGYLHALARSQNLCLFVRPGLGLAFSDTGTSNLGVYINGILGAEMFLAGLGLPHVSLTGGMGLIFTIVKPENVDTGFGIAFVHSGASVVQSSAVIGVHWYF